MFGQQYLMGGNSASDLDALFEQSRQAEEFYKALTAGHTTDSTTLVGGESLRRESLEASLLVTLQRDKHFVLLNKLPKSNAISTIDEWVRVTDVGGVPGSSATAELGDIPESTGNYERRHIKLKYLMDRRRVSVVAEVQSANGLASAVARETDHGTRKLLTDANYLCYYGDETVNSLEFTGFVPTMEAKGGDFVLDMRGQTLTANAKEFVESAALIWGQGNWGMATDYFCSPAVQADIDQLLDPAHRVTLDRGRIDLTLGAPVKGIHTNFGDIATNIDPFIQESPPPYAALGGQFALLISGGMLGAAVVASAFGPDPNSKFVSGMDGSYAYYIETAGDNNVTSSTVATTGPVGPIAVGDAITLTITNPGGTGTHYRIYRSRLDPVSLTPSDFRLIKRIPIAAGPATVFVDRNDDIPGTSVVCIMTMDDDAITLRRLYPLTRFPLYPTSRAEYLWAQILFCGLRVGKDNQHRLIKNVLPSSQRFRPFNV